MSEFDIISKISKKFHITDKSVIKGIGDDCAIINRGNFYEVITTDMYIEEDHFSLKWSSPKQIGIKAFEATVSDIAAMGGLPKYLLVSLCISKKVNENKFINEFYTGFKSRINYWHLSFTKYQILSTMYHVPCTMYHVPSLIGGDTTHGDLICINVTAIAEIQKKCCITRSGAKAGDLICVTGNLGGSWAGLEYLRKKDKGKRIKKNTKYQVPSTKYQNFCILKNLEPHSRLDMGILLSNYASSMIDISDGLASEVTHICNESKVGAVVYKEKIPLAKEVIEMGKYLNKDPYQWALSGGEDFELCFTMSPANYNKFTKKFKIPSTKYPARIQSGGQVPSTMYPPPTIVGKILPKSHGISLIDENNNKHPMPKGYEHF